MDSAGSVLPENMYPLPLSHPPERVKDLPPSLRPREEVTRRGVENVGEDLLLAVILRSGARGSNVIEISRRLLTKHKSLRRLAQCSVEELVQMKLPGFGPVKAQVLKAALELGIRMAAESMPEQKAVRRPEDVVALLAGEVRLLEKEVFWVLCLNPKNVLIGQPQRVSEGILDSTLVHAREVFKTAVRTSAGGVILAHNHPSGDPQPSAEDLNITRKLVEAGKTLDIRVLDHVIVTGRAAHETQAYYSIRETGAVAF